MKRITEYLPDAVIDLKYAGTDNFAERVFYPPGFEALLAAEAVDKLVEADRLLKTLYPGFRFVIWDAARPHVVQQALFEVVRGTEQEKYIAHPDAGSLHNYGCAIDIGILDEHGRELDMGTVYDFFGALAEPAAEITFLHEGILSSEALRNRLLLRHVMVAAGFQPIPHEWWHFNHCPLDTAKQRYPRWDKADVPFISK